MLAVARQDPASDSGFSLDFGVLGGVSNAHITDTSLILELDGAKQSAKILHYDQFVEPLLLPGGFSTGNIRVRVKGPSKGTYDESTGVITTREKYVIHFDGDLSAFQLSSPVVLPGTSVGTVEFQNEREGFVNLTWSGEGVLPNPFDPLTPIHFGYFCDADVLFRIPLAGDIDADDDGDLKDFASLQNCFSGSGSDYSAGACALADYDADRDVDAADFAILRLHTTGPN
jgi:hypothetical protein